MTDLMAAEAGIRRMHARYANAVWRRDFTAYEEFWTEDAEFRIAGLVHKGRDDIVAFLRRAMADVDWVRMDFESPIVDLQADGSALSRTQVWEENVLMKGMGIYWERLVLLDGAWRRRWAMFELHYIERTGEKGRRLDQPDYGPPPGFPPEDAVPTNHSKIHKY
jgi:ketosteroid isomerase-like protein